MNTVKVSVAVLAALLAAGAVVWFVTRPAGWSGRSSPATNLAAPAGAAAGGRGASAQIQEVRKAIPAMYQSGRMTAETVRAMDVAMNGRSFRGRARLAAIVLPAVRRGAMTPEEAVRRITTMRDKSPTEDERRYWDDALAAVHREASRRPQGP